MARQKKKNFSYYLAELIILVLGISLSFILNEYRVQKQEETLEEDLLNNFRDNLILDSLSLNIQLQVIDIRTETAQSILAIPPNTAYSDSIGRHLAIFLNYGGFYPADITYQEMRSLGNSRLINNRELLNELIQLYETDYDLVLEWTSLDKNFMLNQMLPYVNENFPYARLLQFNQMTDAKKRQLMRVLVEDKTRNLVQNSELGLRGSKVAFDKAMNEVRRIIGMINEELGNESKMLENAGVED